jgi:hypothetical protein
MRETGQNIKGPRIGFLSREGPRNTLLFAHLQEAAAVLGEDVEAVEVERVLADGGALGDGGPAVLHEAGGEGEDTLIHLSSYITVYKIYFYILPPPPP